MKVIGYYNRRGSIVKESIGKFLIIDGWYVCKLTYDCRCFDGVSRPLVKVKEHCASMRAMEVLKGVEI